MVKRAIWFLVALMLVTATAASAAKVSAGTAKIFDGYAGIAWGTDFHKIVETYPKGEMSDYNKEMVYIQDNPDETIATRIFAFKDGKLSSVAVTFTADYVKKTGLDNLKQSYINQYGQGKLKGKGSKAHMISYVWEGKKTRVSLIYVPDRPEMTVLQYEQK